MAPSARLLLSGVVVFATSGGLISQHRFDLEIFFETEDTMLPAVARLLVAPEGNAPVYWRAIQVDAAGANSFGNTAHAVDVPALDISGETVGRVVGDRDGLVFGVISHHRQHRTEDFLLGNCHVGGHVREDRGPNEIATVEAAGASGATTDQIGSLLDAALDQALHLVELGLADQRSHRRLRIEWIADPDLIGSFFRQSNGSVALGSMHEHAGWRLTRLTRIGEAAQYPGRDGFFQIGVRKDDIGGFAPKLLDD